MKYLLVWSFMVNSSYITGMASFHTLNQCLEAKAMIKEYKVVKEDAFIECRLIESSDDKMDKSMLVVIHKKINKFLTSGENQ